MWKWGLKIYDRFLDVRTYNISGMSITFYGRLRNELQTKYINRRLCSRLIHSDGVTYLGSAALSKTRDYRIILCPIISMQTTVFVSYVLD